MLRQNVIVMNGVRYLTFTEDDVKKIFNELDEFYGPYKPHKCRYIPKIK